MTSNINLRLFVFWIVYLLLFGISKLKLPKKVVVDLNFLHLITSILRYSDIDNPSNHWSLFVSKLKYKSNPIYQDTSQCSSERNVFSSRGLHFGYLSINSLLSKVEKLRYIAKSTNAAVIGICEFKLDASVLEQEIRLEMRWRCSLLCKKWFKL